MKPERDLNRLLASLDPQLQPDEWVFCQLAADENPNPLNPALVFREREGITVLIPRSEAARAGTNCSYPCRWITLGANSDLDAVGLLPAVTGRIAAAGISCNVVSAYHHDYLLVPVAATERVMELLRVLQQEGELTP
jgi:uncharacterized protein